MLVIIGTKIAKSAKPITCLSKFYPNKYMVWAKIKNITFARGFCVNSVQPADLCTVIV
jgi:hypothetical protein